MEDYLANRRSTQQGAAGSGFFGQSVACTQSASTGFSAFGQPAASIGGFCEELLFLSED